MKKINFFYIFLILLPALSPISAPAKQLDKKLQEEPKKESDAKIIFKNNVYIMVPILAVGFSQWDWGGRNLNRRDEGFFQETTRYGGMDKVGHFYSSYLIADLLSKKFAGDGIAMERASLYGALSAFTLQTLIEIGDATSPKYGFSYEDQLMNTLGALSSYLLLNSPSLNEKIDFKIDYIPKHDPTGLDDYEGMRFLATLNLSGFEFSKNNFWRFISIQTNYSAPGYVERRADKSREWGIGIALNVNELIDYLRGEKAPNKYVHGFFEYYQPRYTYGGYTKDLNER